MIDDLLDEATSSGGEIKESIIQRIVSRPDDSLQALITAATSLPKSRWEVALQAIHQIGFPHNEPAIPALINHVCDLNSPGREVAIRALTAIGALVVVPYLVEALWPSGAIAQAWARDVEGVCAMLSEVDTEYAVRCGPTVAHILYWHSGLGDPDPSFLLDVIERIAVQDSIYALPSLIALARTTSQQELANHAWTLVKSYNEEVRAIYSKVIRSGDIDAVE